MTRPTFFEHTVLERDFGNDLLQLSVLRAQVRDLIAGGFANRIPGALLLASFEEVLAPAVVEIRGDAFSAA